MGDETDCSDAKEEKRNMSLKRVTIVMLSLMLLVSGFAQAAGLFPVVEQLFGVEMPSFGTVAGRGADSVVETDIARQEDYRNATLGSSGLSVAILPMPVRNCGIIR